MRIESIRRQIDEATQALREGDAARALKSAEDIVAADPNSPEGQQIKGIALTRLGDLPGAMEAFRRASQLAPNEPKHLYNLAVNLRDCKQPAEALEKVTEAMMLDPSHAGALQLRFEITGEPTVCPTAQDGTPPTPLAPREGFGAQRHLLPFFAGMESAWTNIGYTFLAFDALLAVLMLVHLPMKTTGLMMPNSKVPDVELRHDSLSIFIVFLYIGTWVCTFMWMFVDVVDLRRRFSWLVPFLACSVLGFTVLPLALYMALGRRFDEIGVT